jgi:hypothetical protein
VGDCAVEFVDLRFDKVDVGKLGRDQGFVLSELAD